MQKKSTPFEKRIINLAIYFFGFSLIFQFLVIGLMLTQYSLEEILTQQISMVNFFVYGLSFIVLVVVNRKVLVDEYKKLKGKAKELFSNNLKYYIAILISNMVLGNLIPLISGASSASNQEAIELSLGISWLPMAISTVVFAPMVEELIFRYSLMNVDTNNKTTERVWWLVSSAIFGFMHIQASISTGNLNEMWFFFQYFAMGLIIGHSYIKSKNIWAPILLHVTMNGISILVLTLVG